MAPFVSLVATWTLWWSLVACGSSIPPKIPLSDFIFDMVALVTVVPVVIVEMTDFGCIPLLNVLTNDQRLSIRGLILGGVKDFCLCTYQSGIVCKLWLVLEVLRALVIIIRRFLGIFSLCCLRCCWPYFCSNYYHSSNYSSWRRFPFITKRLLELNILICLI